jgi:tricorn protease
VRERDAAWSPDGKSIAYFSDRDSKEYELYVRPADGTTERQLTSGSKAWNLAPAWSPDSKLIAYGDKEHTLHVIDAASGKVTDVDKGRFDDINYYAWSPDSKWVVYTKPNRARFSEIWLWSAAGGKTYQLTSGMTDDNEPVFDPKGRYLYFISNRDFNLTFSAFEFNYVYTNPLRVYVGVLAADGAALFLPQSDEEKATTPPPPAPDDKSAEKKADDKKAVGQAPPPVTVKIDVAGFESRVRAIPGAPGNYRSLAALPNGVLYLTGQGPATKLVLYNVDDRKEETVVEGAVRGYDLSANHEKVLVRSGDTFAIIAAKGGQKVSDSALNLEHLEMKIDPRAEWKQEFVDAWRILRDWFYDPNMHGHDWNAVGDRYAQLVPFVASRSDLDYIFGELAGEVGSGHVYVQPADDVDQVKRVDNGLLGADIVPAGGVFQIKHIYPGENWHDAWRSPLTEPGVKAHDGEYIVAVDGVPTRGVDNLYRLLENKAGHVVTLSLASNADGSGAHDEKVRPITKETNVRYLDWVASRRAYVDKASGGRIGYIHLPDTATEGNRELFKYFYPLAGKDALIVDDRYNGGGFIPDRMIELLDRPLLNYWIRRDLEPGSTPAYANEGPKVMLTNMYAGSGGDALPYYFRKRKLGTIIGTRTWGGLIGLSGSPALADGGSITVPTFRILDTQGMWVVEGEGVAPDIEVVDRPELIAAGHDPSLEKAVDLLMQQLKDHPPAPLVVPPPPGRK